MIEVPRVDQATLSLSWTAWKTGTKVHALLRCPKGHLATLDDHEIAADGTVSPSVVCPMEGCGFHETLKLLDWES